MFSTGPLTGRGFYLVERQFMELGLFKKEPFTQREAWLYLVEHAAWESTLQEVNGLTVPLQRGQLVRSYRYLAIAWGWGETSKGKVERLLEKFCCYGWITVDKNYFVERDSNRTATHGAYDKRPTLITIIHYNDLQRRKVLEEIEENENVVSANGTATSQLEDKPNQIQAIQSIKKINQVGREASHDVFLFELFPPDTTPENFINYMTWPWKNYGLAKGWTEERLRAEAALFWERYAGKDANDRVKRHASLERRRYWDKVWQKWCDQPFRNFK